MSLDDHGAIVRRQLAPQELPCPREAGGCGAAAHAPCVGKDSGRPLAYLHAARRQSAGRPR